VFHNKEAKASMGRDIMFRILEASVNMLGTVVTHGIEKFILMHEQSDPSTFNRSSLDDVKRDQVRDIVRPIIIGGKTLFHCINNYGSQREKSRKDIMANMSVTSGLSDEHESKARTGYDDLSLQKFNSSELDLIGRFFEWGLQALALFTPTAAESSSPTGVGSQTVKGVIAEYEHFAASLTVLDAYSFQKVVGSRMQLLINMIVQDEAFMAIPKYLLFKNSGSSRDFSVCIIPLLLRRSPYLATGFDESQDMKESDEESLPSDVKYQLYDALFSSLSPFPKNESVLRPYIQIIVSECIRHATADYPVFSADNMKHFSMMRSLFRALSGGKFEESYKEILPILPTLLNGLYRIYLLSRNHQFRVMILELSLTVPARLSSLLPHLPLMLRIIIPAINSGVTEITNIA
jgi:transformation/transcription domain-associated protein